MHKGKTAFAIALVLACVLAGCAREHRQSTAASPSASAPSVDADACGTTITIDWAPQDAKPTAREAVAFVFDEWNEHREGLVSDRSTGEGFASRLVVLEYVLAEMDAGRIDAESPPEGGSIDLFNDDGVQFAYLLFEPSASGGYSVDTIAEALTPCAAGAE